MFRKVLQVCDRGGAAQCADLCRSKPRAGPVPHCRSLLCNVPLKVLTRLRRVPTLTLAVAGRKMQSSLLAEEGQSAGRSRPPPPDKWLAAATPRLSSTGDPARNP